MRSVFSYFTIFQITNSIYQFFHNKNRQLLHILWQSIFHPPCIIYLSPEAAKNERISKPPLFTLRYPLSPLQMGVCIFLNAFQSDACSLCYWFSATAHYIDLFSFSLFLEGGKNNEMEREFLNSFCVFRVFVILGFFYVSSFDN